MFPFETILNIIVVLIFLSYWLMAFAIVYHLARFGIGTLPKKWSLIFLFGTVILFSASFILYLRLDLNFIPQ